MDFKDEIKQIGERVEKLKENLSTEEATKNALIMPFIQALGYDVFNPLEVEPEFTCDIGIKKGEKIDYAIIMDGKPVILIECKHWRQDLSLHDNQLIRYFNVSDTKFGVITNGIVYRFYTDLDDKNKMDEKPFLEVNLLDIKDSQIDELKKFHKSYFDIDNILNTASELKYMMELKSIIAKEFSSPSSEFVKFIGKQVYDRQFTQSVIEQFAELTKKAISSYINELISGRLKAVISEEKVESDSDGDASTDSEQTSADDDKIQTTEEELEAYYLVKSILRSVIDAERVTYRDRRSYFNVFIDDNQNKPICRLFLNVETNKQVSIYNPIEKTWGEKVKIESIDDLYRFSDEIKLAGSVHVE